MLQMEINRVETCTFSGVTVDEPSDGRCWNAVRRAVKSSRVTGRHDETLRSTMPLWRCYTQKPPTRQSCRQSHCGADNQYNNVSHRTMPQNNETVACLVDDNASHTERSPTSYKLYVKNKQNPSAYSIYTTTSQ